MSNYLVLNDQILVWAYLSANLEQSQMVGAVHEDTLATWVMPLALGQRKSIQDLMLGLHPRINHGDPGIHSERLPPPSVFPTTMTSMAWASPTAR